MNSSEFRRSPILSLNSRMTNMKGKVSAPMRSFLRYVAIWRSAAGPGVAANSYPAKYSRGILYIKCRNSAWSQELSLMSPDLLKALAEAGAPEVERLVFRIVNFRSPLATPPEPEKAAAPPTPEEEEQAERIASAAFDAELGKIIKKAYLAQKTAEKASGKH
ncbi:MAG: DUF721 domain-containing protein [Abditibacteriota bacterium]|nr:DUF721 domain-containing protein [Abditibacteriota bacterium]